ncbi:MAG: hypothetical protein GXP27_16360 [Planctomycetes bacterium]|nr:hypothetical protein [Planctomycetota bacterium]
MVALSTFVPFLLIIAAARSADDVRASRQNSLSYKIVESESVPPHKRSLTVILDRKVSEAALRDLALRLKAQSSQRYERTFITYYLPGMTINAGAWATTHFNPDLQVRIFGLTLEQEKKLVSEPVPAGWDVLGRWLDERPFFGKRVTIFRQAGTLYVEEKYPDGSAVKKKLLERKTPRGRRLQTSIMRDSDAGDHWLLRPDGTLELRDNEGLIATLRKVPWPSTEKSETAVRQRGGPSQAQKSQVPDRAKLLEQAKLGKRETRKSVSRRTVDEERRAGSRLRLAMKLLERGKRESAKRFLQRIVKESPGTKAAKKAKELLSEL